MKIAVYLAVLLMVLSSTGCIFGKHKKQAPPATTVDLSRPAATIAPVSTNTFVITPDQTVRGQITSVISELRFVVLTFPLGQLPAKGARMNVFRNGAIVGEVMVSGPERDDNTVADIVLGDARKGDEVRPK